MNSYSDEELKIRDEGIMRRTMAATLDHFLTQYKNLQFDRQESPHGKLTAALEMISHMDLLHEKLVSIDEELSK